MIALPFGTRLWPPPGRPRSQASCLRCEVSAPRTTTSLPPSPLKNLLFEPAARQSVGQWRVPGQAMQGRREVRTAALRGPTEDTPARSVRGAPSGTRCAGERAPFPPAMTASGRGLLPPHNHQLQSAPPLLSVDHAHRTRQPCSQRSASGGASNFNHTQRSPRLAARAVAAQAHLPGESRPRGGDSLRPAPTSQSPIYAITSKEQG